jgi:hypothetical protein
VAAISAVPPTLDLNLYAGDDLVITLTVVDDAGFPYDLTGSLLAQIRKGHALEIVATFTTSVGTDATLGVVVLALPAMETEALGETGGRHSWDLQHTNPDGFITTICKGAVSTTLDITQVSLA